MGKLISAAVAIVVLLLAGGLLFWHVEYGTESTVTFTVKQLDDQPTSNNGHQYLVFTTNGQVYKNTDSIWHGKTDSSNVQAIFNVGDTYTCPVYGFRIFIFSSYKDILDGCKQVAKPVQTPANLLPTKTGLPSTNTQYVQLFG